MVRKSGVGGLEKVQHGFQMVWERPKIKDENEIPHFMIPHNEVRRVWEQEKGTMKREGRYFLWFQEFAKYEV